MGDGPFGPRKRVGRAWCPVGQPDIIDRMQRQLRPRSAQEPDVLVSVASKHGATREIASRIADELRSAGMNVHVDEPDAVDSIAPYAAVVLGSAVYAGRWLASARRFADRHQAGLRERQVWLFSSGPVGTPLVPTEETGDGSRLLARLEARDHRTFAGRVDASELSWVERTITHMISAPDGDFRDWAVIRDWATGIARDLSSTIEPRGA